MIIDFRDREPRKRIEDMTREELLEHGQRGRAESHEAGRELIIRHRRRMGQRSAWDAPNVVPFPRQERKARSDGGGVA